MGTLSRCYKQKYRLSLLENCIFEDVSILNSFGNTDRTLNGRKSNFITLHTINITVSRGMSDRLPTY